VVYACSGCSDAGELADRIARRLTRDGAAQMSCLAGVGGRVKSLMLKAEKAQRILVIDGCPLNCARHTLELAGFNKFDHLQLHELGMKKNFCPVSDERIAAGVEAAQRILSEESTSLPARGLEIVEQKRQLGPLPESGPSLRTPEVQQQEPGFWKRQTNATNGY
jgi:uncharacterized metal-binding protein